MAQTSFFLQISVLNGRKSHQAVIAESDFQPIHKNASWTRYKLTVEDDNIVEVATTRPDHKSVPQTETFTLPKHKGASIKVGVATLVLGQHWAKFSSKNEGVAKLIDLMDQTFLVSAA